MLRELLVLMLEILARITGPLLEDRLARAATSLIPSLSRLGGYWWHLEFEEKAEGGRKKKRRVIVQLTQFGRKIRGTGHIQNRPADAFTFTGKIKRNALIGEYERSDPHVLAGSGTFVLKISADSREMKGHCLWYDSVLDAVATSPYRWKRKNR